MTKLLTTLFALALIAAGTLVLPMPIPFGAILILCGAVLLISVNAAFALRVKSFRNHHPKIDKFVRVAEARLPKSWRKVMKRTDPDN